MYGKWGKVKMVRSREFKKKMKSAYQKRAGKSLKTGVEVCGACFYPVLMR